MDSSVGSTAPQDQPRTVDPLKLKSKARLRLELAASGLPQKALAYGIRSCPAQVTRYLGDEYSDDLPAHKVPHLISELGPGYMEWLALQCGGSYHHGETVPAAPPITVLVGLLARQSGNTIQQLIQDLSDHNWSSNERQADLPGLRKLHGIVEAILQLAEGGGQ
jgi:hypothetical protein